MIWMFERDNESLQLETRYDNETSEFLLIQRRRDGDPPIERFSDEQAFSRRLETLERQLEAERWTQSGPILLHDGWKIG
jgi:hypothetical protein